MRIKALSVIVELTVSTLAFAATTVVKKEYPSAGPVCPMSEQEFKQTVNPKSIIENRRTSGGPQKAELEKAVSRTDAVIEQNKKWTKDQEQKISSALNELNKDFETYLK